MRIFNVDSVHPSERAGLTGQLLPGEAVLDAYRAQTSTILFTDRRIVTIQLQVLLSERVETTSFSYRDVRRFSMIRGTAADTRHEIRIWLGSDPQPLHLRANDGSELEPLHRLLAENMA